MACDLKKLSDAAIPWLILTEEKPRDLRSKGKVEDSGLLFIARISAHFEQEPVRWTLLCGTALSASLHSSSPLSSYPLLRAASSSPVEQ